jgi:hypothetical protein
MGAPKCGKNERASLKRVIGFQGCNPIELDRVKVRNPAANAANKTNGPS